MMMNAVISSRRQCVLAVKDGIQLHAIVIKDPQCMTASEKDKIFATFFPVALSAFMWHDTPSVRTDVREHLFSGDVLVLVTDRDGHGVAFRSCSFLSHATHTIMYTAGTAVLSAYQGCGVYQALTRLFSADVDYVVSRTQNPVVVTALARLFGRVYPITDLPDVHIGTIAKCVADYLQMAHFDAKRLVGRGFYGGLLAGTVFHSYSNDIEKALRDLICVEKGDCILAVCPTR